MPTLSETSDEKLLALLTESGPMTVLQIAAAMEVTSTAVRQRLTRLTVQGLVQRQTVRAGRGRPGHRYWLTEKARRQAGSNFTDLALVLWKEIRAVQDPEVRKGLLTRIAQSLTALYAHRIEGATINERMRSLSELFAERRVPIEVAADATGGLPVLTVKDCPYPELAEKDRGICAMEKMLFSRLLETDVRLSQCRLEGHACCQFQTN
jgi:predicted ArsR family transcriptional regulator